MHAQLHDLRNSMDQDEWRWITLTVQFPVTIVIPLRNTEVQPKLLYTNQSFEVKIFLKVSPRQKLQKL